MRSTASSPRRRPHARLAGALFLVAAAGSGCSVDPNSGSAQLPALDFNYFACNVDRVLVRRCSMLACHGNPDHALRVYSPGKLRLAPTMTQADRDLPTTIDELHANFASASGLAFGAPSLDDIPLLHKTTAPTPNMNDPNATPAGAGPGHKGGVIFRSTMDPDYAALRGWLMGASQPAGCALLECINSQCADVPTCVAMGGKCPPP